MQCGVLLLRLSPGTISRLKKGHVERLSRSCLSELLASRTGRTKTPLESLPQGERPRAFPCVLPWSLQSAHVILNSSDGRPNKPFSPPPLNGNRRLRREQRPNYEGRRRE